ncbi:hypothetical protein IAQ61_006030 [Plenodomus lingam]|uniref:uncharacterized protein n=1 Tax=Leptosphaeria maculans TaxID=5022 RepID=UPI003318EFE8|nr:hypothetical protein IAQ61_006030 [Plenodomus lingam]
MTPSEVHRGPTQSATSPSSLLSEQDPTISRSSNQADNFRNLHHLLEENTDPIARMLILLLFAVQFGLLLAAIGVYRRHASVVRKKGCNGVAPSRLISNRQTLQLSKMSGPFYMTNGQAPDGCFFLSSVPHGCMLDLVARVLDAK